MKRPRLRERLLRQVNVMPVTSMDKLEGERLEGNTKEYSPKTRRTEKSQSGTPHMVIPQQICVGAVSSLCGTNKRSNRAEATHPTLANHNLTMEISQELNCFQFLLFLLALFQ